MRAPNAPEVPLTEWERHRELLKELYIKENMTLREVMHHMSTHFDFSPSYVPNAYLATLTTT